MKNNILRSAFLMLTMFVFITASFGSHDINFYTSDTYSCDSLYVQLVNSSTIDENLYAGPVHYEWYIDGAFVSSSDSSFYHMLYAGYHGIELKAYTDAFELIGTYDMEVEVSSVPDAINSTKGFELCPDENVGFYYQVTNEDDYSATWDFGDGNMANGNWIYHKYENAGTYQVILIIDGVCGTDTIIQQVTVSETAVPQVRAHLKNGHEFCPGDLVKCEIEGFYKNYKWALSGDEIFSYSKEAQTIFDVSGDYQIVASASNTCGNASADTLMVHVINDRPEYADFGYNFDGPPCPGTPIQLEPYANGKHEWTINGTLHSTNPRTAFVPDTTGDYEVMLVVENGCGHKDTAVKSIFVDYTYETVMEQVDFRFDTEHDEGTDTLFVCPGEKFRLINETHADHLNFFWVIDHNDTIDGYDREFSFSGQGNHSIYLLAVNSCMGSANSMEKTIVVDPDISPDVDLHAGPFMICPGEEVYFFDENIHEQIRYTYEIEFGDGDNKPDINDFSNYELKTLAKHTYASEGPFNYVFTATNHCGNSVSMEGTIDVVDNSTNPSFYYVKNSTQDERNRTAHDWSIQRSDNDFEMKIPLVWADWYDQLDSTFFVYFWYGGVNPQEDPGNPDGYVQLQSEKINIGDTVLAYVPYSLMDRTVGIMAGWYCNSENSFMDEPDHMAMPMNGANPVEQITIVKGGGIDISSLTGGNPITFDDWSGVCLDQILENTWFVDKGDGKVLFLEFNKDEQGIEMFNLHEGTIGNPHEYLISDGSYFYLQDDSIELSSMQGECFGAGAYKFKIIDKKLHFISGQDECLSRFNYLTNYTFERYDERKYADYSACPGEPVKFTIAGGTSHVWHFEDGTVSNGATAQHAYNSPGTYNEYVVATNGCGKTDTLFTEVRVSDNNYPVAGIDINTSNPHVNDTVYFHARELMDVSNVNEYYWDFGDGHGSTSKNTWHMYEKPGNYHVKLKVSNNCGTSSTEKIVDVKGPYEDCSLQASFGYDINERTISFYDQSQNGAPNEYIWEFGDQASFYGPNPTHTYLEDGLYIVKLKVTDTISGCSDETTKEVAIGNMQCITDFEHTMLGGDTVRFSDITGDKMEWTWDFGDDEISTEREPVHIFPSPGYYTVGLTTTDHDGCISHQSKEIFVEAGNSTSCYVTFTSEVNGLDVILRANVSSNITSGYWMFGDGATGFGKETTHTYEVPGEYEICAVAYDSVNDCQARECKNIKIGDINCIADFTYLLKDDGTVEFTNKSLGGNYESTWEFGDGTISDLKNNTHQYMQPGEYHVILSIRNDTINCFADIEKRINLVSSETGTASCKPEIGYFQENTGMRYKFDEVSGRAYTDYYWTFDDNTYSTEKSPEHVFESPGIYNVCLDAKNSFTNCGETVCEQIIVHSPNQDVIPIVADFKVFQELESGRVTFKDNSIGNVTSRYWTFGDGDNASGSLKVSHVYKKGRVYEACLIVADEENGLKNQKCKEIIVGEQTCNLKANFTFSVDPETHKVTFKNNSTGNYNGASWYFDDGNAEFSTNPVHVFKKPGYYLVKLTVKDSINDCVAHKQKLIQVGATDCKARFDYAVDPDSLLVKFTSRSSVDGGNHYWMFGDKSVSTDENPIKKYKAPGKYPVSLTVSDPSGTCSDLSKTTIQVGRVPCNADFVVHVDSLSNKAYFSNTSIGNTNTKYHWYFGDGYESREENPSHRYPAPGYYTITLVTANADNTCIDKEQKTILIGHPGKDCEADFFWSVDDETKEVRFFSSSLGKGLTYSWVFGDGDSMRIKDPVHRYEMAGYYNVCLTVENNEGIKNTTCKEVPVSVIDTINCVADFVYEVDSASRMVKFVDQSAGNPDKWHWDFGDSTGISGDKSPEHGYSKPGYYTVRLVVANSKSGCVDAHYELINAGAPAEGLVARFGYVIDSLSLKSSGKPVDLVGIATGKPSQFAWRFGDGGTNNTTLNPTHVYTQSGNFEVCFSVSDAISGAFDSFCDNINIQLSSVIPQILTEDLDAIIYPNPFAKTTSIHFNLDDEDNVRIEVFNELGKRVDVIEDKSFLPGIHTIEWNAAKLKQGFYMIRLMTGKGQQRIIRTVKQ